mgnify:CR=1 FL=1
MNALTEGPGDWQVYPFRSDNIGLTTEQLKTKYLQETLQFQNFVAMQQYQLSQGNAYIKFTSNVQLQKAMIEWYKNQESAESKYGPIEEWDVSNVTSFADVVGKENPYHNYLESLLYQTNPSEFNRDLSGWDVSNGTDFSYMFFECLAYNNAGVSLSSWDVSRATNFAGMFTVTDAFEGIGLDSWSVSNATNLQQMFASATSFNQPIGNWDVSNVTNMQAVFETAPAFNQPLNDWDVSKVTTMQEMFSCQVDGGIFNQPLSSWNTSNVKNMAFMFNGAESFNQDISNFDFSSVEPTPVGGGNFYSAQRFLGIVVGGTDTSTAMSVANYSTLLISIASQTLNANVLFDAGDTQYSAGAAATARATIVSTPWVVTDGGQA